MACRSKSAIKLMPAARVKTWNRKLRVWRHVESCAFLLPARVVLKRSIRDSAQQGCPSARPDGAATDDCFFMAARLKLSIDEPARRRISARSPTTTPIKNGVQVIAMSSTSGVIGSPAN